MLGGFVTNVFQTLPRLVPLGQACSKIVGSPTITNQWSLTACRSIIRYHFPHPNERRRIKRHGWATRMSTLNGRKILMRRILKGKHVLSH